MSDYDYGRENGLWGEDGIPYCLNDKSSYIYQDDIFYTNEIPDISMIISKYVQLMKKHSLRTIVSMNNYLTKNNLWSQFKLIQRINTYSSGFTSIGVSREAYSKIIALYKTDDIIHTRLETSTKLS